MKFSEIAWSSDQAPATPGIYHIVHEKSVLYVGSTANIYRRFTNHRTDPWMKFVLLKGFDLAWFWHDFSSTDLSQKQRHRLAVAVEALLIREINPPLNTKRPWTDYGEERKPRVPRLLLHHRDCGWWTIGLSCNCGVSSPTVTRTTYY